MADSDKTLKLRIELDGYVMPGAKEAEEKLAAANADLAEKMGVVTVSATEAEQILEKTGQTVEEAGKKTEEAGGKTFHAAGQHRAFRQILGEINRILPGAGHALHLVSEAYIEAGVASETGAVGVASFNAALSELLVTLGPLIIGMLSIEAATKYWEIYSEKVKAAAEAQAEATKRIEESAHAATKAVMELDEALHPKKHNLAEQDEQYLKQQEQALENAATRRKELNKVAEEKEMKGATTKEEKDSVREKYALLDKQLEDWRAKQKVALEELTIEGMDKQLKDLKKEADKLRASSVFSKAYQDGLATGDMSAYNKFLARLEDNGAQAKALREKLDELTGQHGNDASNAAYNSETNRQVFGAEGKKYSAPNAGDNPPSPDFAQQKQIQNLLPRAVGAEFSHFEGGHAFDQTQSQTINALQQLLEKAHLNSMQILQMIVAGVKRHESIEQIIAEIQAQVNAGPQIHR